MTYEIEKGVPLPTDKRGGRYSAYPWKAMAVGDSFVVPRAKNQPLGGMVREATKRLNMKFTTRRVEGGIRIWRIA